MKRRCIAAFSNKCKLLRSPLIRLAVRSTPSSVWEKAFIVVRFSRNLASLHNYCHPPRLISAPNYRPRGSGQRSWTQGVRSTTEGEKRRDDWAELAPDQAAQGFPCHGGRVAVPPSIFIQVTFTSHTGSLLLSSPKKVTSPSFPFVLRRCHIVRASRPSAVGFRQYPLRYTVLITSLPSLARRRCTCTSTVRVS